MSLPQNQTDLPEMNWQAQPTFRPQTQSQLLLGTLDNKRLHGFKLASLAILILSYLYITVFFQQKLSYLPLLVVGLITLVESLAYLMERRFLQMQKRHLETLGFLILTVAQTISLSIWGFQNQFEMIAFLTLHLSFIGYVAARNGSLSQGRLGIMFWSDWLNHSFTLPFKHFFLIFSVLTKPYPNENPKSSQQTKPQSKTTGFIVLSILMTLILVSFAWSQLVQVSDNFSALTTALGNKFFQQFKLFSPGEILIKEILSLPVACWLFGLLAGGRLNPKPYGLTYARFQQKLKPIRLFPQITVYITIGSLCFIYMLFCLVAFSELGNFLSLQQHISPQDASSLAVSGFWQLVRVALLNFAVLAIFYLLSNKPLWERKGTRRLITLLFTFASIFALLAAWKLFGIYIRLYGMTPLRLLSGWFVSVILVWCLLTIIRFYKPFQAIRIGLWYALISLSCLSYLYALLIT